MNLGQQAKGVAAATSIGLSTRPESVQEVHLQNWLQEGVGAYVQAHVQQQQQQQQPHRQQQQHRHQREPDGDEEVDSLLGSFKAIQAQIHSNLGLVGSQTHTTAGSASSTNFRASTHDLAASMAPNPSTHPEFARPIPPSPKGGGAAGDVMGGQGFDASPSKGQTKTMYVVASQSGAPSSSASSLVSVRLLCVGFTLERRAVLAGGRVCKARRARERRWCLYYFCCALACRWWTSVCLERREFVFKILQYFAV